ncbi:hypothetical protein OUZ56_017290 [Daphnia magna]|uniref:Uncharacterized protein n=1 Tax=Daphnia magna TaxID=35525 RepID=A0ABR0ASM0_9CRUS|nr:hypothetical protein OUZ56_017290 [Daphnia magna]
MTTKIVADSELEFAPHPLRCLNVVLCLIAARDSLGPIGLKRRKQRGKYSQATTFPMVDNVLEGML